jgi:hypothetical protein
MPFESNTGRNARRSKAWIYYAIIAALSVVALVGGQLTGLVVAVGASAYSRYLYRGGRVVIWFW